MAHRSLFGVDKRHGIKCAFPPTLKLRWESLQLDMGGRGPLYEAPVPAECAVAGLAREMPF